MLKKKKKIQLVQSDLNERKLSAEMAQLNAQE